MKSHGLLATPPDPVTGLTRRQAELVRHMVRYFREHHYWPTFRELCVLMEIGSKSANAILCHLDALRKKGVLEPGEGPQSFRSFRLAGLAWDPRFEDTPEGQRLRKILDPSPREE